MRKGMVVLVLAAMVCACAINRGKFIDERLDVGGNVVEKTRYKHTTVTVWDAKTKDGTGRLAYQWDETFGDLEVGASVGEQEASSPMKDMNVLLETFLKLKEASEGGEPAGSGPLPEP